MSAPALWTSQQAGAATGGRNTRGWRAFGVSIDSRTLARDDLFIALQGPSFDGHDFVAKGFGAGAAAALVSRAPAGLDGDAPLLLVGDTMDALGALGAAARKRSRARIVAVTGSVGKTGTKEALRLALSDQGRTTASAASFNNHWGVPLSLACMPEDAAFGVFEVGMNHAGEIGPLSRLIRPHVAVITTVAAAHTAFFASIEDIADAKAEIFQGVEPGGAAVLNRDNPHFARLETAARDSGIERIITFGAHQAADARLIDCALMPDSCLVSAIVAGTEIDFRIGISGRHMALNCLAVLAAVDALGADVARAAAALAGLSPLAGRGRRHVVDRDGGAFTVIDESYNANPASMRAAIETLGAMRPDGGARRIAVLGEMRELGPQSAAMHAELAATLEDNGVDLVFAAGDDMAHLFAALPAAMQGVHAGSAAALAPAVAAAVQAGDVVTVKGSLASGMKTVVDALCAPPHAGGDSRAVNG
jgi:UDP-N-acetylmuramoyl-tripeptide--D-alanyl-D-alanine ligase